MKISHEVLKNKTRKRLALGLGMVVILGILFGIFFIKERMLVWKISQTEKDNMSFILALPQLAKIDMNKEVCFDLAKNISDGWSNIDCFVPNKFNEHAQGIVGIDAYKRALKEADVMNVKMLADSEKSSFLQFFDSIQPNSPVFNYKTDREVLLKKIQSGAASKDEYEKWIYILSLEGEYSQLNKTYGEYCSKFASNCKKFQIEITFSGRVTTKDWTGIPGATVQFLWEKKSVKTDNNGDYVLKIQTFPQRKLRIEAYKPGFSNAVTPINVLSPVANQKYARDFVLETPVQFAVINVDKNDIQGKNTGKTATGYTIETEWSKYFIPNNALVFSNGNPFHGRVTAYFFEFNKSSRNENLLENDIFDNVVGYAGNLMKTFGMPYVLFVTDEWEIIHVLKSNPMVLQCKISEMEALRTNKDHIYAPVTNADMNFLLEQSNLLGWYPITREFLIKNNMLRYPVFWVFDQTKGIWVATGSRVISVEWVSEIPFYTISDVTK